jgi:serine/threonine protein phosphatase PrpC
MSLKLDFIADKSLCSNVGLIRKVNEDSCGYAQTLNGNLFVVCDGMGGHVGGATASKIGVDKIIEYLSKEKYPDTGRALNDALVFANYQILGTAREKPELKGMGTTACILLVRENEAWIAHAGDSRIYLYVDREKFLHRITKDHSFVQSLVDSGKIQDRAAETHPQKNIILKALGINENIKPTVCARPVRPAKNDIFLICSDGLSGMIDDPTMESVLKTDEHPDSKVKNLMELALYNGGQDNITAQLIQIVDSPWKNTELNGNEYTPAWRVAQMIERPSGKSKKIWMKTAVAAAAVIILIAGGIYFYKESEKQSVRKEKKRIVTEIKQEQNKILEFQSDTVIKGRAFRDCPESSALKEKYQASCDSLSRHTTALYELETRLKDIISTYSFLREDTDNIKQESIKKI